jgi:hypothetical protein
MEKVVRPGGDRYGATARPLWAVRGDSAGAPREAVLPVVRADGPAGVARRALHLVFVQQAGAQAA